MAKGRDMSKCTERMMQNRTSHQCVRIRMCLISLIGIATQFGICQSVAEEYANILPTAKPNPDTMANCSLFLRNYSIQSGIHGLTTDGERLVKYHLKIVGDYGPLSNKTYRSSLLEPYEYFLATSSSGVLLLMLKDYYEPMSLYTLGHKVADVAVDIIQEPYNCVKKASAEDLEAVLRKWLIKHSGKITASVMSDREICNKHIVKDSSNTGEINYICCKLETNEKLICEKLQESVPLSLLFKLVHVLAMILVIYSPLLLFRRKYMSSENSIFVYEPQTKLTVNLLTEANAEFRDDDFVKVNTSQSCRFAHLKEELSQFRKGRPYSVTIRKIHLCIPAMQLMGNNDSPIDFMQFVKSVMFHYDTGPELSSDRTCCRENIFKMIPCCVVPWQRCLGIIILFFLTAFAVTPWLIRVWFYYSFEEVIRERVLNMFNSKDLNLSFAGSLVFYLTPVHTIFIVIYCMIPVTFILFIALRKRHESRITTTVQRCFDRMSKTEKIGSCGIFFAHILWPVTEFGIVGILVLPLWLLVIPLELALLVYRVVPLVNVSIRLFINCVYFAVRLVCPKTSTCKNRSNTITGKLIRCIRKQTEYIIQKDDVDKYATWKRDLGLTVGLAMCCFSLLAFSLLLAECLIFYMECIVYILIGIILTAVKFGKFSVLSVFLLWYIYHCISNVGARFKVFAQTLISEVMKRMVNGKRNVNDTLGKSDRNSAYLINCQHRENEIEGVRFDLDGDANLKWITNGFICFLDKTSTLHLPRELLFKAASLGNKSNPGPVHMAYLRASVELLCISVFLLFVLLLILVIDDGNATYAVPLTIVSLVGGIFPGFVIKHVLKSKSESTMFTDNILSQITMSANITSQWTVEDLEVCESVPLESANENVSQIQDFAYCGTHLGNDHSLEQQISDFYSNRLKVTEEHFGGATNWNNDLVAKTISDVPKNIDMIAVSQSDRSFENEHVSIYLRKTFSDNVDI